MLQGRRNGAGRPGPSRDFIEGGRAYTSFRRHGPRANDPIAMAIYHLHVKVIGRKAGSSAVASAAYRSASRLRDDRIERSHDFTAKRCLVQSEFVGHGMIADLNVHWDRAEDGTPRPHAHAHVMLTMRTVDKDGFGPKMRDWKRTETVERWRARWAELANVRLAELDIDARIDHRSLEARGIALEPQSQVGASAQRIEGESIEAADRAETHR
jgi:ATP-dependent exoDNAse (exonuclease V) alpha subunit